VTGWPDSDWGLGDVAGVYLSVGGGVSQQHSHRRRDRVGIVPRGVSHIIQRNRDHLGVGNTGQADDIIVRVIAVDVTAGPGEGAGHANTIHVGQCLGEGEDHGKVAIGASAAAFDPRTAAKRQIDIKCAGTPVSHS
jgi:ribosomal protein L27